MSVRGQRDILRQEDVAVVHLEEGVEVEIGEVEVDVVLMK